MNTLTRKKVYLRNPPLPDVVVVDFPVSSPPLLPDPVLDLIADHTKRGYALLEETYLEVSE